MKPKIGQEEFNYEEALKNLRVKEAQALRRNVIIYRTIAILLASIYMISLSFSEYFPFRSAGMFLIYYFLILKLFDSKGGWGSSVYASFGICNGWGLFFMAPAHYDFLGRMVF